MHCGDPLGWGGFSSRMLERTYKIWVCFIRFLRKVLGGWLFVDAALQQKGQGNSMVVS